MAKAPNRQVVSVLGVEYEVIRTSRNDDATLQDCIGYCDSSVKRIVIADQTTEIDTPSKLKDSDSVNRQTIRHEIAHAFIEESGAMPIEMNCEQFSEWLAIIAPRYEQACSAVGAWEGNR